MDEQGRRFSDSKRLEGTLPELLDGAVRFVQGNMRTALRIDPKTGKRSDLPEYPWTRSARWFSTPWSTGITAAIPKTCPSS